MIKITGEYWLVDGDVNYADGDVGDTNHEGFALDHLRRKILDATGAWGFNEETYDWDAIKETLPAAIYDSVDFAEEPDGDPDAWETLFEYREQLDLSEGDINQAFELTGAEDIRTYMARVYGWIAVHRNQFSVWHLTRDAVKTISNAVGDILDQEGNEIDDDSDVELTIFVGATQKTYEVTWREMEEEDYSTLDLPEIIPVIGPNAQVIKMDLESQHPYYQTNNH